MKKQFRRWITAMMTIFLLIMSPTMVFAKGYSGGHSYHTSYSSSHSSSYGGFSTSKSYGSGSFGSTSTSTPKSSGTYHASSTSYSGGSTYQPSKTATTTTRTTRTTFGGSYGYGYRGYGYYPGHYGSFFTGFFLGSMFHPFGWGYGGGYYGAYPTGAGWGGPGYSPLWSVVGMVMDILLALLVIWLIVIFVRAMVKSRRNFRGGAGVYEPYIDDNPFETVETVEQTVYERTDAHLDEQAIFDACCEFVASTRGCRPEDVDVDLIRYPDGRFSADIAIRGQASSSLTEAQLNQAIQIFVASRERVDERAVRVLMQFHPGTGIHATAQII